MRKLRQPSKRAAVIWSSDDESAPPSQSKPTKSRSSRHDVGKEGGAQDTEALTPNRRQARKQPVPDGPAASQSSRLTPSPSKAKGTRPKERTIYSFFNAATQRQQPRPSASPEKRSIDPIETEEDFIQDDDSFGEELAQLSETRFESQYPIPVRRKRKIDNSEDGVTESSSIPRGSQIFKKAAISFDNSGPAVSRPVVPDQRPWTEMYGPSSLEELAIHKKKVQDVRTWLESVSAGGDRKRLLILKGAAGTGKTTTVKLLSQQLGLGISEWKNPASSGSSDEGFVSMSAQFEDFIARTGTFGMLEFGSSDVVSQQQAPLSRDPERKQLVMIEEFPNTFSRTSSALNSFRSAVLQYLEASTPSMDSLFSRKRPSQKMITPIVMIISETLLSTSTASADSFTAYRLLGPEVLTHVGVSVIDFNPVAPTYLTKALELVIQKESRRTGRRRAPGPSVLKHLANTGDIRSAVSSLEFLCLRGDEHDDWSGKVTFTKTKRGLEAPLSKMEMESLETITQRESTLGIFHAVGKVVYNKRELPPATDTPPPQPPTHLPQHVRPRASDVNIETLLNELGTDIQTFVAALHENFLLSCGGIDSEDTLDHVNGCIDSLSDADILSPDRFSSDRNRSAFQGSSADNLRQDEISFQTSVRGLLFYLPHPVKRTAPPPNLSNTKVKGLARSPAYQMFYPNSLRIWRQRDEIDQLLELFINKLRNGEIQGNVRNSSSKLAKLNGVETWRLNRYSGVPTPSTTPTTPSNEGDEPGSSATLLAGGSSAKAEILLEKLPYMTLIEMRKGTFGSTNLRKELERITKVTGNINLNGDEEEDLAGEIEPTEQWSTDKPADEGKAKSTKTRFGLLKGSDQAHFVKSRMDSLVLEDDDIEDD